MLRNITFYWSNKGSNTKVEINLNDEILVNDFLRALSGEQVEGAKIIKVNPAEQGNILIQSFKDRHFVLIVAARAIIDSHKDYTGLKISGVKNFDYFWDPMRNPMGQQISFQEVKTKENSVVERSSRSSGIQGIGHFS